MQRYLLPDVPLLPPHGASHREASLRCGCKARRPTLRRASPRRRCRPQRSWPGCRRRRSTTGRRSRPRSWSWARSGSVCMTGWRRWDPAAALVPWWLCVRTLPEQGRPVMWGWPLWACLQAAVLCDRSCRPSPCLQDTGFYQPEGPAFHLDLFQVALGGCCCWCRSCCCGKPGAVAGERKSAGRHRRDAAAPPTSWPPSSRAARLPAVVHQRRWHPRGDLCKHADGAALGERLLDGGEWARNRRVHGGVWWLASAVPCAAGGGVSWRVGAFVVAVCKVTHICVVPTVGRSFWRATQLRRCPAVLTDERATQLGPAQAGTLAAQALRAFHVVTRDALKRLQPTLTNQCHSAM